MVTKRSGGRPMTTVLVSDFQRVVAGASCLVCIFSSLTQTPSQFLYHYRRAFKIPHIPTLPTGLSTTSGNTFFNRVPQTGQSPADLRSNYYYTRRSSPTSAGRPFQRLG